MNSALAAAATTLVKDVGQYNGRKLGLFTFNFLAPYRKENYLKLSVFSFG